MAKKGKVLMIYTGGTIGMLPQDVNNPSSPLVPANWEKLQHNVPVLKDLPLEVDLEEMNLIDSSDMHPDYWVDIAKVIEKKYDNYDGFVILHGTDTLTWSATALSFLLENLSKPVILTGSQISISAPRSDAVQNLVTSLMIASPKTFDLPIVPEVCIFFYNVLLRGNRSRKISSSTFQGFHSPNFEPLGRVGEHFKINTKLVRKPSQEGFFINDQIEKNVAMFDIFPGIQKNLLMNIFDTENLRGVVLRTFGAGNAPTHEEFLRAIKHAIVKKGMAVVNITQCAEGMVEMGLYDASAQLQRIGVISGVDMTPEAALVKMQVLLGLGYDIEMVKDYMQKDLKGEQTLNVFHFTYEEGTADPVYKGRPKQLPAGFKKEKIDVANIRIDSAKLDKTISEGTISLALFINYPNAAETIDLSEDECFAIPQCLGIINESVNGNTVNPIIECTDRLKRVIKEDRPVQVTIVSRTNQTVHWDSALISIYTKVE